MTGAVTVLRYDNDSLRDSDQYLMYGALLRSRGTLVQTLQLHLQGSWTRPVTGGAALRG